MESPRGAPCELLQWDTGFFGFKIARVLSNTISRSGVAAIDEWCGENKITCLYFLARSDDFATSALAEDSGYRLVDIRVELVCAEPAKRAAEFESSRGNELVRPARPADVPALEEIARESYEFTRFNHDSNFPAGKSRALYETWIRLSCEGYAQAVLVVERDSVPAGYISCHYDAAEKAGKIGLAGVRAHTQVRGLGRALVLSSIELFAGNGAEKISVVTQGRNCAAQRLYQRYGFLTRDVKLWYHKWYRPRTRSPGNSHFFRESPILFITKV